MNRGDREAGQERQGGARACALDARRETATPEAASCHTTRSACRSGVVKPGRGASSPASDWERQQIEQVPTCAARSPGCCPEAELSWQMTAFCSGSEAAMTEAQQAATGARTCIASAIRTIGRNFCSRERIRENHPIWSLAKHRRRHKSRRAFPRRSLNYRPKVV